MRSNMKNIAVLFGGVSVEHEVSVITGMQVVENMDKTKYNPIPVSYTHLRAHETGRNLVCRLLLEKKA